VVYQGFSRSLVIVDRLAQRFVHRLAVHVPMLGIAGGNGEAQWHPGGFCKL
jgi:hypothetical protein